jgi:glycosyltransferase involved in cell wall biosynthesis
MVSAPKISVVMPAYNAATHLDEAVSSILGQTFRDFEFIIINDGSTDATASILKRYAEIDSRIQVYHQENQGMISALNRGCRLARGQYIARMDADDVSLPHRFERQLEYIERHPQIGILGTWICRLENEGSVMRTWCPPTNSRILKWTHFFGVGMCHPSVLMRREVIEKVNFYRPDAVLADDWDLWLRASAITEFGNVPEVLLKYRVWHGSASQRHHELLREIQLKLLASFIGDYLKVDPPIEAVAGLHRSRFEDPRQIRLSAALLQTLYQKFLKKNALTSEELREISWDAAKRFASLAMRASRIDTRASVSLFMQGLQLDYRLLYPSAIMKGVRRALQQ